MPKREPRKWNAVASWSPNTTVSPNVDWKARRELSLFLLQHYHTVLSFIHTTQWEVLLKDCQYKEGFSFKKEGENTCEEDQFCRECRFYCFWKESKESAVSHLPQGQTEVLEVCIGYAHYAGTGPLTLPQQQLQLLLLIPYIIEQVQINASSLPSSSCNCSALKGDYIFIFWCGKLNLPQSPCISKLQSKIFWFCCLPSDIAPFFAVSEFLNKLKVYEGGISTLPIPSTSSSISKRCRESSLCSCCCINLLSKENPAAKLVLYLHRSCLLLRVLCSASCSWQHPSFLC